MKSAVDHWPLRKTEKLESKVMTDGQKQTFRVIKVIRTQTSDGSNPTSIRLQPTLERQCVSIQTLRFAGSVEAEIADTESHPSEKTSDCRQCENPGKRLGWSTRPKT